MSLLEINLAVIAQQDPELAAAVRRAGGGVLTVAQARDGMPTATASGRAVHSAYDPQREASGWAEANMQACRDGEVAVVLGVGLLYHAEALRRCLPRETSMAIVVADLKELHDACAARRLDEWLPRVRWAWGSPERTAERLVRLGEPLRFLPYAPAARLHAEAYRRIEDRLRTLVADQLGGRLHVAVVGPIYGGSLPVARYTVSALEQLGHRVMWIDHSAHDKSYGVMEGLKDPRHRLLMQSRLAELLGQLTVARLAEDPPDLILALAQAPLTIPVLEHVRRKRFVNAMWFVENYRHLTYWQQVAGGYDYWFVIQQGECETAIRKAGAGYVGYLPMAADPAVHRPLSLTPVEELELRADVSFVGAGYANRRALLPRLVSPEWTFKLWGNEWDGAVGLEKVLQRNGARIDSETCVKVFNATNVNINLHSFAGDGLDPQGDFVNPRTFELAAAGAFQLVDHRSLLSDLFTDREMVVFRSADEMVPQVRTWLHDEEGRKAAAEAARRRVLAEHTYVHRMRKLLTHIGVSQPDRIGAILRGERQADRLIAHASGVEQMLPVLRQFPASQRVELKDVAAKVRLKGKTAALTRDELLILMLDEYRMESRDLV